MKFDTRTICCFNGSLQFPLPWADVAQVGELQRATNIGVDVISDADRALLLEDWHEVKKKTV